MLSGHLPPSVAAAAVNASPLLLLLLLLLLVLLLQLGSSATVATYSLPSGVSVHPSCGCSVAGATAAAESAATGGTVFVLSGTGGGEVVSLKPRSSSSRGRRNSSSSSSVNGETGRGLLPTAATAALEVASRIEVYLLKAPATPAA